MPRVSMVHYNTLEEVDRMTNALDQILGTDVGLPKAGGPPQISSDLVGEAGARTYASPTVQEV